MLANKIKEESPLFCFEKLCYNNCGDVMLIAVDKKTVHVSKDQKNQYIYLYDDEPLDQLIELQMHCVYYKNSPFVDINATRYEVDCIKKTSIDQKGWDLLEKQDYKFAIIIPNCNNNHGNYNKKTFLENCIESVLNQTYKNFELIFVDDLSTDNSVDVVKNYNDPRIHIIKNRRKRYNGGSRNVGIEYALDNLQFDYFAFLDSDDWWKDNKVLQDINHRLYNHHMALIGLELIDKNGVFMTKFHQYDNYEDFFLSDNKVWCTAWARIIRKDKIVYFCEDTLMEDRVWSYRQADNVDINKCINIKRVCYVWNRTNTTNSVSIVRNDFWNASAYCHIGHQLQLITQLKHKEMIPIIKQRIKVCEDKIRNKVYQQY